MFVDGSTATNINVEDAISQCKALVGDDESKITIDVLLCSGENTTKEKEKDGNTISNYLRGRSVRSPYHGGNTIKDAEAAHPDVKFRYVVY